MADQELPELPHSSDSSHQTTCEDSDFDVGRDELETLAKHNMKDNSIDREEHVTTPETSVPDSMDLSVSDIHDTSISQYHMEVSEMMRRVNRAVKAAWDKRHIKYTVVKVLILSWVNNDMPMLQTETARLYSLFEDGFGYTVESWKIPSTNPDLATYNKIYSLVMNHGRADNLLIIYYGGHARRGDKNPIWQPRSV